MEKEKILHECDYLLECIDEKKLYVGVRTIITVFSYLSDKDKEIANKATEVFCAWFINAKEEDVWEFRMSSERWAVIDSLSTENQKEVYKAFLACKYHTVYDENFKRCDLFGRALQKFRGENLEEVVKSYVENRSGDSRLYDVEVDGILGTGRIDDINRLLTKFADRLSVGEKTVNSIFTTFGVERKEILKRLPIEHIYVNNQLWNVTLTEMPSEDVKDIVERFVSKYGYEKIPQEIRARLPK